MYRIRLMYSMMPQLDDYIKEIESIWESHWLTNMGALHNRFSALLKEYLDVSHISLFTNGHLALESALEGFFFPEGSEVITTPLTFASTTHAILRKKLVPVFCDVTKNDFTIDADAIENLITDKTVAILPVHVYGHVCDIDAILSIAERHGLKVIFDAAHAFGVRYKGKSIANYGDVTMLSFHASKVYNSVEGGALCYKESELTDIFDRIKNFGFRDGNVDYLGGNAKMTEFHAAMGICNLRILDEEIQKRKNVVDRYRKNLERVQGITICMDQEDVESNYAYMPVVFDGNEYNRDEIQLKLANRGIESRKYFSPLTCDFLFCKQYKSCDLKNAEYISKNILTLPLYGDLRHEEVDEICDVILSL